MSEHHHMDHQMDHMHGTSMGHSDMDHSNMDHSNMDHSDMDHSDMDMSGGMHMMMSMAFHFGYDETILFSFWKISTLSGLIGSMVGIFFMSALYEGLKYYREYLFWKTHNALQYRSVETPANKNVMPEESNVVHVLGDVIHTQPPSILSMNHAIQTAMHLVQIIISYFLMLIFMTYNIWLCIAVTLGLTTGYFLFGWKKSIIIDVTEHCH